jgi:peptidoglycan/xylan/chitin deacetylase (PgdA/CDA1 family)
MNAGATMRVPVLLYHKIDKPGDGVLVRGGFTPPTRFARQLAYLKKQGFIFYTASGLIQYYREHGVFPKNGITLTLDDGWKDNYLNAFPILREFGVKATVFLVHSCIGEVSKKAMAPGENARAHLAREEILEMARYGIEFGSHTVNHRWLPDLPLTEAKFEVEESKRQLEDLVQQPCNVFAYPAGYYNDAVKEIVSGAGYQAAFTTNYGPTEPLDLFALNRIEILRRDRFLYQVGRKTNQLKSS